MTIDEMVKLSERANKVKDSIGEWEITDQVRFLSALAEYLEKIELIINKYDPNKPKKFIFKRLDES